MCTRSTWLSKKTYLLRKHVVWCSKSGNRYLATITSRPQLQNCNQSDNQSYMSTKSPNYTKKFLRPLNSGSWRHWRNSTVSKTRAESVKIMQTTWTQGSIRSELVNYGNNLETCTVSVVVTHEAFSDVLFSFHHAFVLVVVRLAELLFLFGHVLLACLRFHVFHIYLKLPAQLLL